MCLGSNAHGDLGGPLRWMIRGARLLPETFEGARIVGRDRVVVQTEIDAPQG
jgi:hypothetical protein